jgi:uroporphyrinogen-III decarboxylase
MIVTHKERMRRALLHEPVDRIPTQISYTGAMGRLMAAHLGVVPEELPARLDNHLLRVDILAPAGTGLLLAPSHRLMADIPLENVDAMLEAIASLGGG